MEIADHGNPYEVTTWQTYQVSDDNEDYSDVI